MSHHTTHALHFLGLRKLWKPAAVIGAGSTALAIWFEEIMLFAEEILTLFFLSILSGVIYLLALLIKSQ